MKKFFAVLGSVLLISFLISCSALSSSEGSTSLIVQLSSTSSRSADIPEWAQDVSDYSVTLEQIAATVPNESNLAQAQDSKTQNLQPTYQKESKVGGIIEFKDIQVGEYTVTVYCFDSNGSKVGEGSNTATVREGEQSSVRITISQVKTEDADSTEEEAESEQKESDTKNTDEEVTKEEAKNEEASATDDANTDKTRTEPVAEEKPVSDDSQNATSPSTEVTYGGTVSLNGTEYSTLAEALVVANQTEPKTSANTITFNGNIKANLLTMKDGDAVLYPWHISQNLVLNLQEKTLCWSEFIEDENNKTEQIFFNVPKGKTLVIKNGTITSESGVEHTAMLFRTTGGTIVLDGVTVRDVKTSAEKLIYITKSSSDEALGSLYCNQVTITDCSSTYSSGGYPIYIYNSYFYASKTNFENLLGDTSVVLTAGSQGSFVAGSILLTSSEKIVDLDSAVMLAGSDTKFYLASSTVYSNASVHGIPVIVSNAAQLNLADGFPYKYFDITSFGVKECDSYIYADSEPINGTRGENVIAAAQSSTVTRSTSSTSLALSVGSEDDTSDSDETDTTGQLYISGYSSIYGVTRIYLGSVIAPTGEITSSVVTRLAFGDTIANFATQNGNGPLYWGSGSDSADANKANAQAIPDKFSVFGEYIDKATGESITFEIGDSRRKVNEYAGQCAGNTIYAPVQKTE